MEAAFGSWFHGRQTDAEAIGRAVAVAREAHQEIAPATNLPALEANLCLDSAPDTTVAQTVSLVRDAAERLRDGMSGLESVAARAELRTLEDQPLDSLRALLAASRSPASELLALLRTLAEGRSPDPSSLSGFEEDARLIQALRGAESATTERSDAWRASLGLDFKDGQTDWDTILARIDWLEGLFENLGGELNPTLVVALSDRAHRWPDFEALRAAAQLYEEAVEDLTSLFLPDRATAIRGTDGDRVVQDNIELCARLADRLDDLPAWADYRRVRGRIAAHGWERFADLLAEDGVTAEQVVPAFRKAYWSSRLDRLFEDQPELREFRGRSQERLIQRFKELDRRLIEAGTDRIIEKCNGRRSQPVSVPGSEVAILEREAKKKRRHFPVRHLLQHLPSLLPALKPCLMMSPLTVSHYLSAEHAFDLVVFDEASQVPPWDAINCIYRGAQLIVVGDSKQLPPTPFFQQAEAAEEGWDDDEEAKEELMESILDACEVMLPSESLRWHYRSRHEHLISFSNHHFYGNRLVTFPAPEVDSDELGVHLHHVPDGVYDRARSNTNRLEAKRVAETVMRNLREHPDWTLGVVAFSVSQADAIADEIDLLRSANPDLDPHFAGDRLDGVFVKNLESVQGDERDVIVFSVGYARDSLGKFYQGFGPLNKEGGHRRLNVAVTRARQRVDVVTSVLASDFNLAPTAKPGALRLRDYLEFAERGPVALSAEIESQGGDFESPFEESVAEAARSLGYEIVPQVGVGGFRIDLGVVDPGAPGRFLLGIECDGATYHSTPTARDRDRLRQEILEGLGWRIHRIWSWDWVRERGAEVVRLDEAIQDAIRSAKAAVRPDERASGGDDGRRIVETVPIVEVREAETLDALDWVVPYGEADISGLESGHEFHESESRYMLRRGLSLIFEAEAPICEDRAVRLLASSQGITRRGSRVRATAKELIDNMVTSGHVERRDEFLWLPDQVLDYVRIPDAGSQGTRRDIEEIPPEELDLVIENLVEGSGSTDTSALVSQTARIFGFSRTGPDIKDAIRLRVEALGPRL
jgi:very-short-patch-repair endonuclease